MNTKRLISWMPKCNLLASKAAREKSLPKPAREVLNKTSWGKRRLTYPIKGNKEGFYATMAFKGLPAVAKEIERLFRINDKIIRGAVFRMEETEEVKPEAQPQAQADTQPQEAQPETEAVAEAQPEPVEN